jgi:tetratricopeptide (TPR) repeat protein
MANYLTPENITVLLEATRDDYRLVRMRSADTLAALSPQMISEEDRKSLNDANAEFEAAMQARPDDAMSYYNLANFYMDRGNLPKAIEFYETAMRLRPDNVVSLVNASLAYARLGSKGKAEELLNSALEIDPQNAEANFNMGLLKAEQKDPAGAERHLRTALKKDPQFPEAAYNLGVLIADKDPSEGISWCSKAYNLRPQDARYAYTLAFYLGQNGDLDTAIELLQAAIQQQPGYIDVYLLLGDIYEKKGKVKETELLYRKALTVKGLSSRDRYVLEQKLQTLLIPEPFD